MKESARRHHHLCDESEHLYKSSLFWWTLVPLARLGESIECGEEKSGLEFLKRKQGG